MFHVKHKLLIDIPPQKWYYNIKETIPSFLRKQPGKSNEKITKESEV